MKTLISLIVVILLVIGGFLLFRNDTIAPTDIEDENNSTVMEEENEDSDPEEAVVREFVVETSNFSFTPNNLTVNEGDTVRITVRNEFGMHDFVLDEFAGARTSILNAGQEEVITFIADRTGTFEFYCSVGTHRQMGMVGTLTVE
ncbi:MAG: plastocyanin/azurin family copper-binding protein [Parcubacteria group bacterium]